MPVDLGKLKIKGSSLSYELIEAGYASVNIMRSKNKLAKEAFRMCYKNVTCSANT